MLMRGFSCKDTPSVIKITQLLAINCVNNT